MKNIACVFSNKQFVFFCAIIFFCIHCSTLHLSPITWLDETMIVEFGRTFCEKVDFSRASEEHRTFLMSGVNYLGDVLHYLANCVAGRGIGPRLLTLFCFCLSGIVLQRLLFYLTKNGFVSNFTAILWLCEPMVTQSVRGARADVEAFLLFFIAVWALCRTFGYAGNSLHGTVSYKWLFLSFLAIELCVFIWMTSVVLVCFYLGLLVTFLLKNRHPFKNWLKIFVSGAFFAIVGTSVLMAMIPFPLTLLLGETMHGTSNVLASNASFLKNVCSVTFTSIQNIIYLAWLMPIACATAIRRHLLGFICSFIPALFIVCISSPYVFRVIYLAPGYAILLGICLNIIWIKTRNVFPRTLKYLCWCACVCLCLMFGWTICGRTYLAFHEYELRHGDWLYEQFAQFSELSDFKAKVYSPCEFLYYVGRELHWNQYDLPSLCDYLVLKVGTPVEEGMKDGYVKIATIHHPKDLPSFYGQFEIWKKVVAKVQDDNCTR